MSHLKRSIPSCRPVDPSVQPRPRLPSEGMSLTSITLLVKLHNPVDQDAWERFVQLYAPMLVKWSRHRGFLVSDAEDIAQEVCIRVVKAFKADGFEQTGDRSFRRWLSTIYCNVCHDFRVRQAKRPHLPGANMPDVAAPDPEQELEELEYRRALVQSAMAIIKCDFEERTWVAFDCYVLQGRPAAEVAAKLNVTTSIVHHARERVLQRLREEVEGLMD